MKSFCTFFLTFLCLTSLLVIPSQPAQAGPIAIDAPANSNTPPTPANSVEFGTKVVALSNGNVVITDPGYNMDTGRVYLMDGAGAHAIISTLDGDRSTETIGSGGVTALPNGDYLVFSPKWYNNTLASAGAVTYCSGVTGCSGIVTTTNSLVGSHANDQVGNNGVIFLPNGNFLVESTQWYNTRGAVTLCPPTGCLNMVVDSSNSLIGASTNDQAGSGGALALSNSSYVVLTPTFHNATDVIGAATFCPTSGCQAVISADTSKGNSVVGSQYPDGVGGEAIALSGGGYVLISPSWTNNKTISYAGAVTTCPTAGCAPGEVSTANSLVGNLANDKVGGGGVLPLPNGSFVVASPGWNNNTGAVTYCAPGSGQLIGCNSQSISSVNSLVGQISGDQVGSSSLTLLASGGYVVGSANWNYSTATAVGAVTPCPDSGCRGILNAGMSLIGATKGDEAGRWVTALPDGGYVVESPLFNGASPYLGAVTTCPALANESANGCVGHVLSAANSLLGSTKNDQVGANPLTILTNGDFVVPSPNWTGSGHANAGAATFCAQSGCLKTTASTSNSLVGSSGGDFVGGKGVGAIYALATGGYVVESSAWSSTTISSVGAVTPCLPGGCTPGALNNSNSLVGWTASDSIGSGGVLPLDWGGYIILSPSFDNHDTGTVVADAGAATLCRANGCTGSVSDAASGNSVIGGKASGGSIFSVDYDYYRGEMVVGRPAENKVTFFYYSPAATTTAITSDLSATTHAWQAYTVSASVSSSGGIPSKTVIVSDDAGATCTITLVKGSGSCSLVSTQTGVRQVTAKYQGDPNFATSTSAAVTHTVTAMATCYHLTLSHTGSGSDPQASPAQSPGCSAGQYVSGDTINLTAVPSTGYQVASWTGTSNDASTNATNALSMPAADHTLSVIYILITLLRHLVNLPIVIK